MVSCFGQRAKEALLSYQFWFGPQGLGSMQVRRGMKPLMTMKSLSFHVVLNDCLVGHPQAALAGCLLGFNMA